MVPSAEELRDLIDRQQRYLGEDWLRSLDPRKQEEAGFHDADRLDGRDLDAGSSPNRRFYEATTPVRVLIDEWIGLRTPGATFLDYACGNGLTTQKAARAGASLAVGIDISPVSVQGAERRAREEGLVDRTRFLQRDCEATGLPEDSFDTCVCSGMLHHLDLTRAFPELHRIMRPGGRILCVEALGYNPVIQAYRRLTPSLRTEWERKHILGMREVRFARRWFDVQNLQFHLMTAPLATLLPRGWSRRAGLAVGHAVDALLTRVPFVRLWSWQFTFELVKPT